VSKRLGQKYQCVQEVRTSTNSQTKRRRREWMTFINNGRSGSESFSCIIILNWAKPTDHSRAIGRADQESTVPCCRVKTLYLVRLQSFICPPE
jgi:hypothetical protein